MKSVTCHLLILPITFMILIPKSYAQHSPFLSLLIERRNAVSTWVSECKTPYRQGEISDFHNKCLQKDTLSWAGYVCFAAALADDNQNNTKRCKDVENSQGVNGRWWRGPGAVDIEKEDSFSRDMSLGLASWLLIKSNNKKEALIKWLKWIEQNGNGKMCKNASDSRCEIKGNQKAVFKAILNEYNINGGTLKDFKVVKKINDGYSFTLWSIETGLTPVDYQLHLKSIELLILKWLNNISNEEYLEIAKKIYDKDPLNPFYEYLYRGISTRLLDRVLYMCPSTRNLQKTVRHGYGGDWTWQRDSKERSWEIANGHDCVFIMNLMIAELKGQLTLPRVTNKKDCPIANQKLGVFEEIPICAPLINNKISLSECKNQSNTIWTQGDKQWCLKYDSGRWVAEFIREICPKNYNQLANKNNYIVCEKNSIETIRLSSCVASYQSITSEKISANSIPEWCYLNKGQWFERRKISGTCPIGHEFQNTYVWDIWPVCKGYGDKKSKCMGTWDLKINDKCWLQREGWFEVRNLE